MRNEMLEQRVDFGSKAPIESPFFNAKKEISDRRNDLQLQIKRWFSLSIVLAFISIVLAVSLVIEINQRKIIPIVVGLDAERGEAVAIGRADENLFQPTETEIRYFLSKFILDVRSVPLDQIVLRKNINSAYNFLGKSAAEKLSDMMINDPNNPVTNPGSRAVSVQPITVVKIENSSSYQARWKESVYTPKGDHVEDYTMLATFTVDILPPKTEEDVFSNPLGILIQSFSWNRELSGERK